MKEWSDKACTEPDYHTATKFYGGKKDELPLTTKDSVLTVLRMISSDLQSIMDELAGICPNPEQN